MANKYTLSYAGFYGNTFEEFIKIAHDLGFSGVQLIPDQTPNLIAELSEARIKRLKEMIEELSLSISVHSIFYDINLVSVVPEVRSYALSILRSNFEFACALGAKAMTVHPGYMFPGWRSSPWQEDIFWRSATEAISKLDNMAQEYRIKACLENGSYYVTTMQSDTRTPLHIGITVDEMRRLLAGTSQSVGLCLDVGKAHVSDIRLSGFFKEFAGEIGQIQIAGVESWGRVSVEEDFAQLRDSVELVFEGGRDRATQFLEYAQQ